LTINVKIRTFGVFKGLFGGKFLAVKLKRSTSVKDVVQKLAGSEINDVLFNALILVNGKEISVLNGLETIVLDGDEILLLPVSHGG